MRNQDQNQIAKTMENYLEEELVQAALDEVNKQNPGLINSRDMYSFDKRHKHQANDDGTSQGSQVNSVLTPFNRASDSKDLLENDQTPAPRHVVSEPNRALIQSKLRDDILQITSSVLKISRSKIETREKLSQYGADSLIVTELIKQIGRRLDLSIRPTIFFEAKHLDDLVVILYTRFEDDIRLHYSKTDETVTDESYPEENKSFSRDVDEEVQQLISRRRSILASNSCDTGSKPSKIVTDCGHVASDSRYEPIAIIAMEGVFPESPNLVEFEKNLREGKDCIRVVPKERWDWESIYGDPRDGDLTKVKFGGFVSDFDKFDPLFFGISPKEAEWMDPQHRLFIQCAWKLLESAGFAPRNLPTKKVGVFLGINLQDYYEIANRSVPSEAQQLTGLGHMFCPNRLSFLLDLHGPSEVIDTACSSSLVAVHRAALNIQHDDCEMAIAGGVNLMLSPTMQIVYSKAGMICEDGRCKAFSKHANGYARSDGVGAVLLKKLNQAQRDGDIILGVIRGSSENHGGSATSLTAPNPKAQAALIADACKKANLDPRCISYIECHGTGTSLGDPIEIEGLKMAFEELRENGMDSQTLKPYCGLGSVKSNIGHAETAAGIAGLIKVLLGLKNRYLYRTLHCESINPLIELDKSPFYILQEGKNWERPAVDGKTIPRIAGISSFGAGGSNAHVIVEEFVERGTMAQTTRGTREYQRPFLIVLSAKNQGRLKEMVKNLQGYLEDQIINHNSEFINLHDLAYTLQVGREAMEVRLALIVRSADELIKKLKGFLEGQNNVKHLFHGQVKHNKEALAVFSTDEELKEAINKWIQQKNIPHSSIFG